jgi:alginate O-acetyltransferase complex protein AlgJ
MGWGASAGLAEQMSFALGRDIDVIALNDNGAYAAREALSLELQRGRDRLAGKKVVIWEFAERELSVGDWKPMPLVLGSPPPSRFIAPARGKELTISGVVRQRSGIDLSSSSPYADQVVAMHLVDVQIADQAQPTPGDEAIVYLLAVRQRTPTSVALIRPGQRITLRLRNWADVAKEFGRIRRTELQDESLQLAEPSWGEFVAPAR